MAESHQAANTSSWSDMARPYQPGEVITEEAFTSVSLPGGTYQRGGYTLIIIESVSGCDISMIAHHVTEREVLFMPGTRFRVVSVEANGHSIRMVEVLSELRPAAAFSTSHSTA